MATAEEDIFSVHSTGLQNFDHISLTRTSEDNCEKLQESFVTFARDDAHREATKNCKSTAAKVNKDALVYLCGEGSGEIRERRRTTNYSSKFRQNFFPKLWKENAVDEKDKFENED